MLKDGSDIYEPVSLPHTTALVTIICLVSVIVLYYFVRWLRRRIALKRQANLLKKNLPQQREIIQQAIEQLHAVLQKAQNKQIKTDDAGYQASYILRSSFDKVMNHTTLYQSMTEAEARHLNSIVTSLQIMYPLEFASTLEQVQTIDELSKAVNAAVEALQTCI